MYFYEVAISGKQGNFKENPVYNSDKPLALNSLVLVTFANTKAIGVIIKKVNKPKFPTKPVLSVQFTKPLPKHLISLAAWLGDFYGSNNGNVWQIIIPSRLKSKLSKIQPITIKYQKNTPIKLNQQQLKAIEQIDKAPAGTFVLHGRTGSGKTEVYKALTEKTIKSGRSAIILVPEISLTTQLTDEFSTQFKNVVVIHSRLKDSERKQIFSKILLSTQPLVIIGARSALFSPVKDLGLIVIDECHEPSYKQEASPRYSAITVAAKIAALTKSKLVLGSATPLITDYYLAKKLNRPIIKMDQLAINNAIKPEVFIIDLTKRSNFNRRSYLFSDKLLKSIENAIRSDQQVLLFHNRRGSASMSICEDCGYIASCPKCFLPLTLHADEFILRCHLCGYRQSPALVCPECGGVNIINKGVGTKKIEAEAKKLFPDIEIARFDSDTPNNKALHNVFNKIKSGEINIIIGTQVIAKGLDLPNLAVVGIVQADAGLALPDFSARERTFQLISQAIGRVGRYNKKTTVIVQTYQSDHEIIKFSASQDYDNFYKSEIKRRQLGHFPPFSYLLKLQCSYKTEQGAIKASTRLANLLKNTYGDSIRLLGPSPSLYERRGSNYHWQIVVRSSKRSNLSKIANSLIGSKWQIELDPYSLL